MWAKPAIFVKDLRSLRTDSVNFFNRGLVRFSCVRCDSASLIVRVPCGHGFNSFVMLFDSCFLQGVRDHKGKAILGERVRLMLQ